MPERGNFDTSDVERVTIAKGGNKTAKIDLLGRKGPQGVKQARFSLKPKSKVK